jgi:hypothetical protein
MKLQYLGDSKDSFKWDYHHFLVQALGYSQLKIVWMMTPDDGSSEGKTAPALFPASPIIIDLCKKLRITRNPELLLEVPTATNTNYKVSFHTPDENLNGRTSSSFFSGIAIENQQVIFLDPDKGFEPERSSTDGHIRYADLDSLIKSIPPDTIVTVFQHHRRKKFPDDFARIRERMLSGYSTAIYWQSLMFVILSSSPETIARVCAINHEYGKSHPVHILV